MRYSYRDQVQMLQAVQVREGQTHRMDCPFCGGRKTLTLSKLDGKRIWNCYKASCGAGGSIGGVRDLGLIKRKLSDKAYRTGQGEPRRAIPLPSPTSPIEKHEEALRYVREAHSMDAYEAGLVRLNYDPKQDRVLFWLPSGRAAVGRSLKQGHKPKWLVYGDLDELFVCGTGGTAVVVEDAASACAVGVIEGFSGVALLGTNVSTHQKNQLRPFRRALIALDKDASNKAAGIARRLDSFVPLVSVRYLKQDLKDLSPPQIIEALNLQGTSA